MTTNVVMLGDGKRPMAAREFRAAIKELQKSIGPQAYVKATIGDALHGKDDAPIKVEIWRIWAVGSALYALGETFDEALTAALAVWEHKRLEKRAESIGEMALAIIKTTDERGVCTDADLRQKYFSEADIRELGTEACAKAAEMGGRAPFAIVSLGKSNAA